MLSDNPTSQTVDRDNANGVTNTKADTEHASNGFGETDLASHSQVSCMLMNGPTKAGQIPSL